MSTSSVPYPSFTPVIDLCANIEPRRRGRERKWERVDETVQEKRKERGWTWARGGRREKGARAVLTADGGGESKNENERKKRGELEKLKEREREEEEG